MKTLYKHAFIGLLVCLTSLDLAARDWPQWRGPFLNGSSDETNLPAELTQDNLLWKIPLPGPSGATAVISRDHIFVSSADRSSKNLWALCFEARTGRQLWKRQTTVADRRFPRNNLASPSPAADGQRVFFMYGNGRLCCFDYDGNNLWNRDIEKDYGNLALMFGYSNSPFLFGGRIYITILRRDRAYRPPDNTQPLESYLLALDPATGKTLWKQVRKTEAYDESHETYSTPVIFDNHGRVELLLIGAENVTAHDPETGRELWRYKYARRRRREGRIIPSLVVGDNLIFATRPKHEGVYALQAPIPQAASPAAREVWQFSGPSPDASTPLFYRDHLYVLDGITRGKVVSCLDPHTGKLIWQGKIGGRGPWRASLTGVDGKLYCINETGELIVLQAGGNEFKPLFQGKLNEGPIQSSISVAHGCLFVRTARNLYCFGNRKKTPRN